MLIKFLSHLSVAWLCRRCRARGVRPSTGCCRCSPARLRWVCWCQCWSDRSSTSSPFWPPSVTGITGRSSFSSCANTLAGSASVWPRWSRYDRTRRKITRIRSTIIELCGLKRFRFYLIITKELAIERESTNHHCRTTRLDKSHELLFYFIRLLWLYF